MQYGRHNHRRFLLPEPGRTARALVGGAAVFDSASRTPPLRMLSAIASVASASHTARAQPQPRTSAKSDAPAVKRKAEERWADDHNENSLHLPRRDVGP